ncbi:MAG: class I adenylate-forming enzyme family protein [bacterium]|nr:class I adenylate-forming enzyme family protein [bacterium]
MATGLSKNFSEHIALLAKRQPDKTALVATDEKGTITEEITYADLLEKLKTAAAELKSLGLQKGDRIALAFRNSPALLIWSWAAWASGIVTVPMDTKRDTPELYAYKINLNKAKVLILERGIQTEKLPGVRIKVHTEFKAISKAIPHWEKSLSHQALVLFTSGTTGHPKGAMLSLENLIVNADSIREWLRITAGDTFLVNLPLHHINSTTFCLSTLLAGGTIAIPPNYSNSNFWGQMAKTGATVTSIVQSILFDQVSREKEFQAVREKIKLNRIQIGSAPVVTHTVQEFRKKYGIAVYQGYGQTETALRVTGVPMDISEELYEKLVEENSIGEPMSWADLQIMDEDGKFLGEGEEGELVVKGPAVMEGYLGREPAFCDLQGDARGYFLTGDIGYYTVIDDRKYFYLKGRKKEIIIKGGVNVSPVAVENALKKISADIDQVHVVSVPDERYGEEAGAVISWKEGIDEERAKRHLKSAFLLGTPFLSAYETPKYITSLASGLLPMTSTGKVQRSVLKSQLPYERFESIYGLLKTSKLRFSVLHRDSRWLQASFELYNKCWAPLTVERSAYEKGLSKQLLILAAKPDDTLAGQIALIRTNLSGDEILKKKYAELFSSDVSDRNGKALVCVSICSADYRAKEIPSVTDIPDIAEVQEYLPNDPVYKFHQKPKGGGAGAELIGLIPAGRPEDASSLGYNMLLKYPEPHDVVIDENAPVSNQLIEVVLLLAEDLGIKDVYAYSRPGGLASYLSTK